MSLRSLLFVLVLCLALPAAHARSRAKGPSLSPEQTEAVYGAFERGTRSADLRARGLSVLGIGHVPGKSAAAFVVDALKDPQWVVRRYAVVALALAKDKRWQEAMDAALRDPTLNPSWEVLPVLAALPEREALGALLAAAKDPKNPAGTRLVEALVPCDLDICAAARRALAKEGYALFLDRVQAGLATTPAALRLELLRVLLGSGRDAAQRAAMAVIEADPPTELAKDVRGLFQKTRDNDLKLSTAVALARLGDSVGAKVLNGSLAGADRETRLKVLGALASIPKAASEKDMLALLAVKPGESVDLDMLTAIFEIYYKMGSDKPWPRAKVMVNEPDPATRAVGVRFVARFEGPVALKSLHELVLDGSVVVRRAAVESIADFARVDSVESLGVGLNDVDKSVKLAAIRGLGRIQDTSVIRHLTFVVGDPDPEVKREALLALSGVHDPAVVPTLQMGLVDPSIEVRTAALRGMLESDPANGRMYFQSALLWLPPDAIRDIARVMGREALPYLREATRSDAVETRMLAVELLSEAGDDGLTLLAEAFGETIHEEVRERVARILLKAQGAAALPTVLGVLEQPGHDATKLAILDGLARLRDVAQLEVVEKRMLDTAESVRVAAAFALLAILDPKVPVLDL